MAFAYRMGIAGKHRLNPMPSDLGQIRVVHSCSAQMRDVAMSALVGTDV
jgi:hypothetical protein